MDSSKPLREPTGLVVKNGSNHLRQTCDVILSLLLTIRIITWLLSLTSEQIQVNKRDEYEVIRIGQSNSLKPYVTTLSLYPKSNNAHDLLRQRFLLAFRGARKVMLFLIHPYQIVKLYCNALKKSWEMRQSRMRSVSLNFKEMCRGISWINLVSIASSAPWALAIYMDKSSFG